MDELDTSATRITRSYPTSLGDVRDDLKKQILLNHTGSRLAYNQIPLVHGRSVGARLDATSANGGTTGVNGKCGAGGGAGRATGGRTRMASHQRNLSLDFRSMGIVLPPVSQVTNTRVNLTQHHRNRSLDSALQGIPEVEVSSPSAELEKTICTNSLYGATMCSKIYGTSSGSANSAQHQPPLMSHKNLLESEAGGVARGNNEFSGDWSDDSDKPRGASPSSSLGSDQKMGLEKSDVVGGGVSGLGVVGVPNKSLMLKKSGDLTSVVKKRDDLTCLGSDDSGIICNSEHEHPASAIDPSACTGLGIRMSRDSISSMGDDMIEENEDEMFSNGEEGEEGLEDEDDLPPVIHLKAAADEEATRRDPTTRQQQNQPPAHRNEANDQQNSRNSHGIKIRGPSRIMSLVSNSEKSAVTEAVPGISFPSPDGPFPPPMPTVAMGKSRDARGTMVNGIKVLSPGVTNKHDHEWAKGDEVTSPLSTVTPGKDAHKNDVMFKNFFGATKNAIFRTAQSIIDNHEKKSSSKKLSIELAPGENAGSATDDSPSPILSPTSGHQLPQISNHNTPTISPVLLSPTDVVPAAPTTATTTVIAPPKKREFFTLKPKIPVFHLSGTKSTAESGVLGASKDASKKLPGTVQQCVIKEKEESATTALQSVKNSSSNSSSAKADHNGLLRFFESPIFNIHFAVHYLFYSKEPGVLMFIANKIFSFPDDEVDLYIPQLVLMYTQMDELAEILDSYLVYRCRKSVDFSLKCAWLLEAYNLNVLESMKQATGFVNKVSRLYLLKELYPKRERKFHHPMMMMEKMLQAPDVQSPVKKTHHRSQSDATGLLGGGATATNGGVVLNDGLKSRLGLPNYPKPLALGDLTTGRAFDNGCLCFETVRGTVNDLRGHKTVCSCGAPKLLPEREFMKTLIEIGRTLTSLPTKSEKTTALRMFLNLINKNLPARVWLPLHSEIPHHVVRITEDKTAILNSKDKTPYIIYVEVVEVNDIYTSPVMPKLMPTLRHTKSEEHLESALEAKQNAAGGNGGGSGAVVVAKRETNCSTRNSLKPDDANDDQDKLSNRSSSEHCFELRVREDDVWSQEDDEITAQYIQMQKLIDRDAVSQLSMDSCDSKDQGAPVLFNIRDVRNRHCVNLNVENTRTFSNDPEDPSAAALKEPWDEKEKQIRMSSPYGHLPNWKLLSVIVKSGDDLRQELMATQLLQMFRLIWEEESVDLWVRPYKIVCLSNDSGLIEPILNTVSIHQIKKNSNKSLKEYFIDEYGDMDGDRFQDAQRKFMHSCAAYCLISYLLQVKDRHNGNILLHSDGHLIHIDFGFILNISPKNLGFEQSPFKLTPEFVDVMGGPTAELWTEFKHLLLKGLLAARKHMERIINIVEIMRSSSQLPCFKNGCSTTVRNLRNRFHMGLTEQELERKVEQLIQDSLNSLSTKLYDGYQYYTNGIL